MSSLTEDMEWKFRKMAVNETKQNPAHVNFFRENNEASEVSSFVREDIQNRLDARSKDSDKPVRVRYQISRGEEGLDFESRTPWMGTLRPHLEIQQVSEELTDDLPPKSERMDFLVAEDFETTGLRGNWNAAWDEEALAEAEKNDFYWFVRNVGRSNKHGSDRGRWGLGKIVYPACSKIRSFFAYSVRASDKIPFMIGRAVLPIHPVAHMEWVDSEGYFGCFNEKEFCTPIDDEPHLQEFAKLFRLSRKQEEAGTSLVIPFVVDSITPDSLHHSVLISYFWEFIQGHLVVEIAKDDGIVVISNETLEDSVESLEFDSFDKKGMRELCAFARKAADFDYTGENSYVADPKNSLDWRDADSWFSAEALASARTSFSEGCPLCFEIPVTIQKKGGDKKDSYFHVYLETNPELGTAEEHFIRDGLTINGQKALKNRGVRSLVVAEDRALADLLGDSENPSHSRWIGANLKGKYSRGPQIVSFVKNASTRLVNLLTGADEERDDDLLATVFGLPLDSPPQTKRRGPKKKKVLPPKPNPVPVDTPFYALEPFSGGFQFRRSPKDTKADTRDYTKVGIRVRCAYDGTKNPLKDHSPFDFDLSDVESIRIETSSCDVEFVSANEIRLLPESKEFAARITGFDSNRDLLIKSDRVTLEEEDEGESNSTETEEAA